MLLPLQRKKELKKKVKLRMLTNRNSAADAYQDDGQMFSISTLRGKKSIAAIGDASAPDSDDEDGEAAETSGSEGSG